MPAERIEVIAYSGYKGEETPRTLILDNERIEVTEILDRWVEEELGDRKGKRCYVVKGSDGNRHELYYDEKAMEWYYLKNKCQGFVSANPDLTAGTDRSRVD